MFWNFCSHMLMTNWKVHKKSENMNFFKSVIFHERNACNRFWNNCDTDSNADAGKWTKTPIPWALLTESTELKIYLSKAVVSYWPIYIYLSLTSIQKIIDEPCISKTSGRRAKRSEIWASGVSIQYTQGTFDIQVIKVILGSLGACPNFDNLVS